MKLIHIIWMPKVMKMKILWQKIGEFLETISKILNIVSIYSILYKFLKKMNNILKFQSGYDNSWIQRIIARKSNSAIFRVSSFLCWSVVSGRIHSIQFIYSVYVGNFRMYTRESTVKKYVWNSKNGKQTSYG